MVHDDVEAEQLCVESLGLRRIGRLEIRHDTPDAHLPVPPVFVAPPEPMVAAGQVRT